MKKIKFILLIICLCSSLKGIANNVPHDYEYWKQLIHAISYVESRHNPKARNGAYVGCLQIGPGMVRECNNILKRQNSSVTYSLNDRYDTQKSHEMFVIFQNSYNPSGDIEKAIRMWNGGPGYTVRSTNHYYNAVMDAYNNQK